MHKTRLFPESGRSRTVVDPAKPHEEREKGHFAGREKTRSFFNFTLDK